jgi:hypothetical protein
MERRALKDRKEQRMKPSPNGVEYSRDARIAVALHAIEADDPAAAQELREMLDPTPPEEPDVPETFDVSAAPEAPSSPPVRYARVARLSMDQKLEIASFYDMLDVPTRAITAEFRINDAELQSIAQELSVTPRTSRSGFRRGGRRAMPGRFVRVNGTREWQPKEPERPTPRALPPEIEAMREVRVKEIEAVIQNPPPVAEPEHSELPPSIDLLPEWVVEYVGTLRLHARSIDEALATARKSAGVTDIVAIRRNA